ncbi:MAG: zinc protease [Glaciecola sp.]|jgi:zinc protease
MSAFQPPIVSDFTPSIAKISTEQFGDVDVHYLHDENCEICKVEWVFETGTSNQNKSLQANFAVNLLLEGIPQYNSKQFAQKLDELGAYFGVECGKDYSSFTLHVLDSNLTEALDLIYPIFIEPTLDEIEFNNFLTESRQDFEHNLHNTGFIARQKLRRQLYDGHVYGNLASLKSFDEINLNDIKDFAKNNILQKKYKLFVSGKVDDKVLGLLKSKIANNGLLGSIPAVSIQVATSITGLNKLTHDTAKQDAVRLGINVPNQDHPDFLILNLINTILGGYFGARLMQNIREEKGWTYGINSSIVPGKQVCSLTIGTDVLQNKGHDCIVEIKKEIKILQNKLVSEQELLTVSAYIKGNLLRSFDGVFQQMDRYQSTHLFGLTNEHYLDYMSLLNTVSAKDIQSIANKHLNVDSFTEVMVTK